MRAVAISGGLREPSTTRLLVDRLAAAVHAELGVDDIDVDIEVIELRRLARAITDAMVTGFASPPRPEISPAWCERAARGRTETSSPMN